MIDQSMDAKRIAMYYNELVTRYGHDPRAVDASGRDTLIDRYRLLSDVADMSGRSVLEVGCGTGDLGAYIAERYDDVDYLGIDLSPRMIEKARQVHPGLRFEQANVLDLPPQPSFDIVIAQGIFYLLEGDSSAKAEALVRHMYQLSRHVTAFTGISTWADHVEEDREFRLDPSRVLAFSQKLTRYVVLRHDHHPGDVGFYLYHHRNRSP